ncbi:MAG: glycosyltransferase family A protein [Sphingomonas sp.]|jgi:hypothetical protein|uniref:glycosyltransferase family 2 protein n=1 Tax=Sphingomonas sp. TaxID=28214 RepID=UPI003563D684
MLTFVVMPCLNEVTFVAGSAASLGFLEATDPPPDAHLIVVDNGSSDGTLRVLHDLHQRSNAPVHVVTEAVRGFVPPRRRGVVEAEALAESLGIAQDAVLILQADADTTYREGYVETMQRAAVDTAGVLFEGSTKPPADFVVAHPLFFAAQRMVDDSVDPLDAEDEDEVVVDDKVCGYRLSDYVAWGGLFDERTPAGDAIHAETTRMFIRARLGHRARKLRVNPAGAIPSRRKVIENPWLQYATAGFPREESWVKARTTGRECSYDIDAFSAAVLEGREPEAVFLRRAHQLALFRYLPALVAEEAGAEARGGQPADVRAALAALPQVSGARLARQPGQALLAILALIDVRPDLFGGS